MIYTLTLNPSLDYVVRVSDFKPGNLHRTQSEELYVGGKGINVTAVLKQLGADSLCLGFTAGFTGREIEHRLQQMGICFDFVTASEGTSRINVKLKSDQSVETEINGQGPVISAPEVELLYRKLEKLQDGDTLVLSGSAPGRLNITGNSDNGKRMDERNICGDSHTRLMDEKEICGDSHIRRMDRNDIYADICSRLTDKKLKLVVDAEGQLLRNTLKYRPFLIKPNLQELGRLFERGLTTYESILECARKLQEEGAQNVLVSLGGDGALLVDSLGGVTRMNAPRGKVLNSVGAGDALVAGFLYGLIEAEKDDFQENYSKESYRIALKYGIAAGSAAAFTEGFPGKDRIEELYRRL